MQPSLRWDARRVLHTVPTPTARKDDAPAAVQAAMAYVAGLGKASASSVPPRGGNGW